MLLHLSPISRAIIFALIAYTSFSIADASAKFLLQTHSVSSVMFKTATMAGLACFIWILSAKGIKGFAPPKWRLHLLRGFCVSIIAFLCVTAFGKMPLPDFYAISFMSPFVTAILAAIILKEPLVSHRMIAIGFGFIGIITVIFTQLSHLSEGAFYAFAAVIVMGFNILVIRRIGEHEFLPLYGFFPFLFITLGTAPFAIPEFAVPAISELWVYALYAIAVFVGQILISLAFATAPAAAVVSPFHYTQMLWGIGLGYLVFNTIPTIPTLAGGAIIILAGFYMIITERWHQKSMSRLS
jgi:drug/metabolite transporter (DMT)-like permease